MIDRLADPGNILNGVFYGLAVAAIFAEPTDFRACDADFDVEIVGNLRFQILVKLRFKLADFSAANAGHMDVIARTVTLVIVAMAAQMQKIEFVDEAVTLEQVHRAIDRHTRDIGIDPLRAFEDLFGVHVARRAFEHFNEHHSLTREANSAGLDLPREMAGRFMLVDTFAGRRTMREGGLRWVFAHGLYYTEMRTGWPQALKVRGDFLLQLRHWRRAMWLLINNPLQPCRERAN